MKENIKIGLLGVIAIATVANLFMKSPAKSEATTEETESNAVATNVAQNNPQGANALMDQHTSTTVGPNEQLPLVNPPAPAMPPTNIAFGNMVHDFGKIKQDSENNYDFKFVNTGNKPLLITNAQGSCGCTVPDYPKEPIAPGKSAVIKVAYKPGKQEGVQEKTVTVTANTDPPTTILKIKAEVLK
jgi:hypothetical protein